MGEALGFGTGAQDSVKMYLGALDCTCRAGRVSTLIAPVPQVNVLTFKRAHDAPFSVCLQQCILRLSQGREGEGYWDAGVKSVEVPGLDHS